MVGRALRTGERPEACRAFRLTRFPLLSVRSGLQAMPKTAVGPHPARDAWTRQLANIALIAAMTLPAFIGMGGLLRMAFPAAAVAIAAALFLTGRFTQYVTFLLWLFLLTPAVRRFVDLQAGWADPNLLLIAPYAAGLITLVSVPALIMRRDLPCAGGLLAILFLATYGLLLAVYNGRLVPGTVDYLRWAIPPALAAFIIMNRAKQEELKKDLLVLLEITVPLLAAYGIYQFFFVPNWDALWMRNVEMTSIGQPEPMQVRVFSTLNSPGPFAAFLMFGLTLLLAHRSPLKWLGLGLGVAALALTMVRTSWIGLVVCFGYVLAVAPRQMQLSLLSFAAIGLLVAPMVLVVPQINEVLSQRFASLFELTRDTSYGERLSQYQLFFDVLDQNVAGYGLAQRGPIGATGQADAYQYVDGGYIELFLALGSVGGLCYLAALASITYTVFVRGVWQAGAFVQGCRAVVISNLLLLVGGLMTVAEVGALFWTAVGIAAAAIPVPASPVPASGRAPAGLTQPQGQPA